MKKRNVVNRTLTERYLNSAVPQMLMLNGYQKKQNETLRQLTMPVNHYLLTYLILTLFLSQVVVGVGSSQTNKSWSQIYRNV